MSDEEEKLGVLCGCWAFNLGKIPWKALEQITLSSMALKS